MFETITGYASYLEHISLITYPIVVFLGFLSGVTALTCLLPLVPAVAGFIGIQRDERRRFFVVPLLIMLGSAVTLVSLGLFASFAGIALQKSLGGYWSYFIGAVCVIVGLYVLGAFRVPAKMKLPKLGQKGLLAPFLFGLCLGGVLGFGSACCLPVLPIILTYAAIEGRPLHGALVMTAFAVGQSIPLFAIGFFSGLLGKLAGRWSVYVRYAAGLLLLLTGIYFIWRR